MIRCLILILLALTVPALALPPIPTDGTTGHTVFTRPKVAPKIIDELVSRLDGSGMVYSTTVSRLNFGTPLVYPATIGRKLYSPSQPDYWGDDSKLRSELWEDSAGVDTWPQIKEVFPELPAMLEAAARQWGQRQLEALVNPYGQGERESWHQQQRDAEALLTDPTAPAPLLRSMAQARGITPAAMAGKVMENVALFQLYSGQILGTQQALLDLIAGSPFLKDIFTAMKAVGITEVKR